MNLNKKPLLLAIAVGMGLVPLTGVFATPAKPLNDLSTSATPRVVSIPAEAKEGTSEYFSMYDDASVTAPSTVNVGGDMDVYIYAMPGYKVRSGDTKNLRIKVSLTGGVKFNKTPRLLCPHSADSIAAGTPSVVSTKGISAALWSHVASSTATVTEFSGGTTALMITPDSTIVGQSFYTFTFPDGFNVSTASSGACLLTFSAGDPYPTPAAALAVTAISVLKGAVAGSDVTMNVETTYNDFFTSITKTAAIKIISFVTAYKAEFAKLNIAGATHTGSYATIDVGTLSKRFLTDGVNVNNALAGHVIVTAAAAGLRGANGVGLSAKDVLSGVSITVSGPTIPTLSKVSFHQPKDVSCTNAAIAEGVVVASTTSGSTSGTTVDSLTIPFTTDAQYSGLVSSGTSLTPTNAAHSGFLICLQTDGNKPMAPGFVSITVNGVTPSGKTVELGTIGDIVEVKRNGTAVRVLNIPLEAADPNQVNIRMFNTSSQPLTGVKGTLYGVDGAVIKDDMDLLGGTAIDPYGLKLVKSTDVVAMLGTGSTAKGRAWMLIQAPVQDTFKVQVLMKNPSGVLSNISTDATD